uniref:Uncharacterized protein n=1 Tax=Rhizophagus irregularis (strain DAOM 181602 / DAOM 197198 / MUCL 43194) TaxID=747089 RepID=U9U2Q9_RHIID
MWFQEFGRLTTWPEDNSYIGRIGPEDKLDFGRILGKYIRTSWGVLERHLALAFCKRRNLPNITERRMLYRLFSIFKYSIYFPIVYRSSQIPYFYLVTTCMNTVVTLSR